MKIDDKDIILFNGDSITDDNRDRDDLYSLAGHSRIISDRLKSMGKNIACYNRGIGGNRTCDLVARIDAELDSIKPTVLCMLIGINDVWRKYDSNEETSVEQFLKNYEDILQKAKAAGVSKIMLLEPFLIKSEYDRDAYYADMMPKILIIRALAEKYNAEYIPLDGIFAELSIKNGGKRYSGDGVHLTVDGYNVVADEFFKRVQF